MATRRTPSPDRVRTKILLDVVLLALFVVANMPRMSGTPVHEWLGLAFVVPLGVHLALNWPWIVTVTQRMFGRLQGEVRVNHVLDLVIYVLMVLVVATGVAESRAVLPALGLDIAIDRFWERLHALTTDALMVTLGVHLGTHARWILDALKRLVPGAKAHRAHAPASGVSRGGGA